MQIKTPKFLNRQFKLAVFTPVLLTALLLISPIALRLVNAQEEKQNQKKSDNSSLRPTVKTAVKFDLSPPLRSLKPILKSKPEDKADDDRGGQGPINDTRHDPDSVVQLFEGNGIFNQDVIPPTMVNFDGVSNPTGCGGCAPPDTNGEIGRNHYVQMVNVKFQIFTRSGVSVFGPANTNTLFTGFGGPCETENAGDPVVIYDQLADRWLLTQFTDTVAPFFNCVAISTTGDPTGTYYRYAFSAPAFPDYPKYAVWPDAYYLNTRESGVGVLGNYALERAKMLVGNPSPLSIRFTVPETSSGPNGLLPSDLDGSILPPAGSPNYFVGTRDNGVGAPSDALMIYKFRADFATPANSTFTGPTLLPTAAFDSVFPCTPTSRDCIQQPGTAAKIDILSSRQRPIFRLAYRNFGTHESMVTNQSVEAVAGQAGVRWWEIRSPNTAPVIFQEGTYAPADDVHRWMGSIAMDNDGNMGLGYSVSNGTSVFPGIRYTGRLVTDPLGSMPQGEGTIVSGSGSQGGTARWGDYSAMTVDPIDDCTFWYTNEYYTAASSGTANWKTRIGSFRFPSCLAPTAASAHLTGRVMTPAGRGLSQVRVTIMGGNLTEPRYTQTNMFGFYRFADLPVGETYVLTVESKRYRFAESSRVISLLNSIDDFNFVSM